MDISKIDFSRYDVPQVLSVIFHPRPDYDYGGDADGSQVVMIPVEEGVEIGAKMHASSKDKPTILFFHGNGEIVSDYDDLGPFYARLGLNFFPVDYRGYGRSGGEPTITHMMRDAHQIFDFVKGWLEKEGFKGPIIIMGRSLGSASAIELARRHQSDMGALIIESGFASAGPLMALLGVRDKTLTGEGEFDNKYKMPDITIPTLIIHAEYDHIIPHSDGEALYEKCGSEKKTFLTIYGANHNNLLQYGMEDYMNAVRKIARLTSA